MSISSEISRLTQAKADIKTAIESKGVTVPSSAKLDDYPDLINDIEQGSTPNLQTKSVSITENGTTTVEPDPGYDGLSEVGVSVNVQGGGGGGASEDDDVRFIDYDGTLLYSYSASEFLALTSMPENPTHEGLTSQGWNWSLADAKEQVTEMGTCDIGQMYITDDGKTRIYIELHDGRLSPYLGLCPNGTVEIDWGDGTSTSTLTGTSLSSTRSVQHIYSSEGKYLITINPISGTFAFNGASQGSRILRRSQSDSTNTSIVYSSSITEIYIGSFSTGINDYSFRNCYNLKSITIPSNVTTIGTSVFSNCYNLNSITIPKDATSIGNTCFPSCRNLSEVSLPVGLTTIGNDVFSGCYSLKKIAIPHGVTAIGSSSFYECKKLASITIPDGVTAVGYGAFNGCSALKTINIPDNLTSIGNSVFYNCYGLEKIIIPQRITTIDYNGFYGCQGLKTITIPDNVTSIGAGAFQGCYSLKNIDIPEGVTVIKNNTFYGCLSLSNITVPNGVTSIENSAFYNCYGVGEYHFLPTTPPTLGGSSVFSNISSDCKIYVPAESLEAYQSAQYWSSHKSKMVGE